MSGSLRHAAIVIGLSALTGVGTVTQSGEGRTRQRLLDPARPTRAKAFLRAHGLLAREPAAEVMLDPSKVFGIKMRLVQ